MGLESALRGWLTFLYAPRRADENKSFPLKRRKIRVRGVPRSSPRLGAADAGPPCLEPRRLDNTRTTPYELRDAFRYFLPAELAV